MMTLLWIVSIRLKNVSIVDLFWGLGFVVAALLYFLKGEGFEVRKILVYDHDSHMGFETFNLPWWRNAGKGEDFRYRQFRKDFGEKRYWWISYFQVFFLQGILMWLISAPLLGAQFYGTEVNLGWLDFMGIFFWLIGFTFEAGGDFQLARFKANPENKGKVLDYRLLALYPTSELFRRCSRLVGFCSCMYGRRKLYSRIGISVDDGVDHQGLRGCPAGENTDNHEAQYADYKRKTSAFLPWFPKKK